MVYAVVSGLVRVGTGRAAPADSPSLDAGLSEKPFGRPVAAGRPQLERLVCLLGDYRSQSPVLAPSLSQNFNSTKWNNHICCRLPAATCRYISGEDICFY